jgi:uncharacterized membrane protein
MKKNPLESLHVTLLLGLGLAVIAFLVLHVSRLGEPGFSQDFWPFVFRWIHVFFGVLWIGLLYYFNFVQIPSMPKIPDEQKPAIGKVIAPTALFFFRWAAAGTVLFGIITALLSDYFVDALFFQSGAYTTIGIGMWLAAIMAFNVWFIIWPNQKKALGIVTVDADAKKRAARTAMLASRFNTMLSIPMLYCMVGQQHGMLPPAF